MNAGATAQGAQRGPGAAIRPRSLNIALNALAYIAHAGLLVLIFHSFSEFMFLARDTNSWYIASGITIATWGVVAHWTYAKYLVMASFIGLPFWFILLARYRADVLAFAMDFAGRWGEFLWLSYLGEIQVVPPELGYFSIWLVMLAAGTGGWVAVKRNAPVWAIIPGLSVLVFQWFFHFDPAERYLVAYLIAAVVLVAALQYRVWLSKVSSSSLHRISIGNAIVASILLLMLVMSVVSLFQEDIQPWRLTTARRWFTAQFPILDRVRGEAGTTTRPASWFSMGMSGYGSPSDLGGPLELDDTPAFEARISARTGELADLEYPLYLRGRTLTEYTGRGWLPDDGEEWEWYSPGERLKQIIPTDVRTQSIMVEIEPHDLETNTVFGPGDTRQLELAEETQELHREDGGVAAKSNRGDVITYGTIASGQTYEVTAQIPLWNVDPGDLTDEPVDEDKMASYLQVPEKVPGRVHDLAEDITEDAEGAYKKAEAITEYLRDFPYSLSVSHVPADAEFTEHFLFEERTGYCTYHSTAMAILLRSVDVPTRWVQGFVLSRGDVQEHDEGIVGKILYSQAHAWVEVWIPGHGWVPFEATPAYPGIEHQHDPEDDPSAEDHDGPTPDLDNGPPDGDYYPEDDELNDFYAGPVNGTRPWDPRQLLPLLWGTLALLLISSAAIFALVRIRDRRIAGGLVASVLDDRTEHRHSVRVVGAAATTFDYLGRGLNLALMGNTPRELVTTVKGLSRETGELLEELVELYEEVIYGNQQPGGDAAGRAVQLRREILLQIRGELGVPRYIGRIFLQQLPYTARIAFMRV